MKLIPGVLILVGAVLLLGVHKRHWGGSTGQNSGAKDDTTVTIRSTYITSGQESKRSRSVFYRSGPAIRRDSFGDKAAPAITTIANCDKKSGFLIDWDRHEYRAYKPIAHLWSDTQIEEYLKQHPSNAVRVESQTVDTGERSAFLGYSAKHLITTTNVLQTDHNSGGKETIDGWYIDGDPIEANCVPASMRAQASYVLATALVVFPDAPQFHHVGPIPVGLAVESTRTITFASTQKTVVRKQVVEELLRRPLKPSLFRVPVGFRENPQLLHGTAPAADQVE